MELLCQRCDTHLVPSDAAFCSHCGLPQLRVSEDAIAHAETAEQTEHTHHAVVSAQSSPRADWRFAMRCAIAVAAPAAVLLIFSTRSDAALLMLLLWILTSSTLSVVLYHRGRPSLPLSFKMGARIGTITGTVIATMLFGIFAVSTFVTRFQAHSTAVDTEYRERVKQMVAQKGMPPEWENKLLSPEGKAGTMAASCLFYGMLLIGMSAITGAAGGAMLRTGRFTPR